MPIDSLHPNYNDAWETVTTNAFAGDVLDYIPRLVGQSKVEYNAYRERATYFNVTRRTAYALVGALLRKPYESNVETDDVKIYGDLSFDEFLAETILGVMTSGRMGLLCDYNDETGSPYIVSYPNCTITNWRMNNNDELEFVILREDKYDQKPDDPYAVEHKVCYRELTVIDGAYTVRIWHQTHGKQWEITEEYVPSYRGSPLTFIPFVFINSVDTTPKVCEPTLYNLGQINISHFRTSADIEHAAHFTALPQPYISGALANDKTELPIGTFDVWQLEEGSTTGYLEFSGSGISSLQDIQKHKEDQMGAIGTRMLQDKKGVESVEALRIRQGSESATLVALASAVENGFEMVLAFYDIWNGGDGNVDFMTNKDFSPATMSPQEMKTLMEAYLAGTISQDTFLTNLFEGEIVNDVDEEKAKLSKEEEEDDGSQETEEEKETREEEVDGQQED